MACVKLAAGSEVIPQSMKTSPLRIRSWKWSGGGLSFLRALGAGGGGAALGGWIALSCMVCICSFLAAEPIKAPPTLPLLFCLFLMLSAQLKPSVCLIWPIARAPKLTRRPRGLGGGPRASPDSSIADSSDVLEALLALTDARRRPFHMLPLGPVPVALFGPLLGAEPERPSVPLMDSRRAAAETGPLPAKTGVL